jgi:hypothetical protein
VTVPAPRRLVLSASDLDALVRRTGAHLPPPFGGSSDTGSSDTGSSDTGPFDAGPFDAGPFDPGPVHPSLAANLSVLAHPDLLVRMDATLPEGVSRAVFTVAGSLGASLFAVADGAVELSMFAGASLGRELIRGVPELAPDAPAARIHTFLAPESAPRVVPWHGQRVNRTALTEYGTSRRLVGPVAAAQALRLGPAEAELVAGLTDRTRGTLRILVHSGHTRRGGMLVGALVWVATDAGWIELTPSDVDTVEPRPVAREQIGTRLAPFIGQVLAEVDDDAA